MGSTGEGKFGDYKPSGEPRCDQRIDVALEEVARSGYFQQHGMVPPTGTVVILQQTLNGGRLTVTDTSGAVVGLLPTSYHYLIVCFGRGYAFDGFVTGSRPGIVPSISVSLVPSRS